MLPTATDFLQIHMFSAELHRMVLDLATAGDRVSVYSPSETEVYFHSYGETGVKLLQMVETASPRNTNRLAPLPSPLPVVPIHLKNWQEPVQFVDNLKRVWQNPLVRFETIRDGNQDIHNRLEEYEEDKEGDEEEEEEDEEDEEDEEGEDDGKKKKTKKKPAKKAKPSKKDKNTVAEKKKRKKYKKKKRKMAVPAKTNGLNTATGGDDEDEEDDEDGDELESLYSLVVPSSSAPGTDLSCFYPYLHTFPLRFWKICSKEMSIKCLAALNLLRLHLLKSGAMAITLTRKNMPVNFPVQAFVFMTPTDRVATAF